MAATTSTFGTYAPAAIDPFPIESVLAKIVGENNPDNAANLLDLYQVQRGTSEGNYNYAMQQQHDFARQQLAQQLKEKYLQYGQEALKTPGGISLLRSQGGQDALGPDFGPDQISTIETNLGNAQLAGTAEKAGSAAWHGVQAGFPPNLGRLTSLSGGLFDTQGTPLSTTNLMIKEANANSRAAAGGGAGPSITGPGESTDPNDKTPYNINYGKKYGPNDPRTIQNLESRGIRRPGIPQALPTDNGPGGSSSGSPTPNSTRLGRNPAAPPASAPPAASGSDIRAQVERNVENKIRLSNPTAYNDIVAGKVGGKVNIVGTTPDGRPIIQGKQGRYQ